MTKMIDYKGKRFGSLVVLNRIESPRQDTHWLCKCDCGKSVVIAGREFSSGRSRCGIRCKLSFGKTPNEDIEKEIGKKYGKLTILRRDMDGQRDGDVYRQIKWICQCDCGKVKSVRWASLRIGETKSCGYCGRLPMGEHAFRIFVNGMKQGARIRGLEFNLTNEQIKNIATKNCFYCGTPPSSETKSKNGNFIHNGVDRVDNSIGYNIENVVPCCTRCNLAKRKSSIGEFKEMIESIYEHWILKK